MKQSSTLRVLGALFVAAGVAATAYPADRHFSVHKDLPPQHEELKRHVEGGGAVGVDAERSLLHPLPHYLFGFLEWSLEYGMAWSSLDSAVHALEVSKVPYLDAT